MKDITQYFTDTGKPNDSSGVDSVEEINPEDESERLGGRKRNRVKIKISRRSTNERVCRIVDNNNDMVDKTPSPFPKLKEASRLPNDDTPKKATVAKVPRPSRRKTSKGDTTDELEVLAEVNLNHDSARPNTLPVTMLGRKKGDSPTISTKNANINSNQQDSLRSRKTNGHTKLAIASSNEQQSQSKKDSISGKDKTVTNGISETPIIDLTDNNDKDENRQTENAFQILMNKSKVSKSMSPVQTSSQDADLTTKKSDEQKEKLKKSKEKLTALANKKGFSKRKLIELEEGEVIEKNIQNRIKLLTGENKKNPDSASSVVQANEKQPNSSLFNYFSKSSSEAPIRNVECTSTFVVTADVHVSQNSDTGIFIKTLNYSKAHHDRRKKKQNVDLQEIDCIEVIESETAVTKDQVQKKKVKPQNKDRWSLRIKLQETDNVIDYAEGDSSDEEIFSRRKKIKETKSESDSDVKIINRKNGKQLLNGSARPNLKKKKPASNSDESTQQPDNFSKSTNCSSTSILHPTETQIGSNEFNIEDISDISKIGTENCGSESENTSKRKTVEKLAPLFTKRRKPDPDEVERRRLFLQSDISETETKSTDRKPTNIVPFPRISHVTQYEYDTTGSTLETFRIPIKLEESYTPILDTSNHKYILNLSEKEFKPSAAKKLNKQSIEAAVAELEEQCAGAINMWDKVSTVVKGNSSRKSPKIRNKKGKLVDKNESTSKFQNTGIQEENSIWLYKYRPKTTHEVVGNDEAVGKLRDWLDGWRATLKDNDGDSSDEFYLSDSSYTSSNENNLVAVLLGPHGSGKSASVYAVAEELGYTVLEVNASSRRTGKKLLKEFEEATKSHRIRKEKDISLFKTTANNLGVKKVPQNSLILLEDIDVLFDEDEGFVSAVYQLVSNTKRPIVMTCRNVCPHLSKMAPQQNRIYFQNPTGKRVTTLFELISLAETGYKLSHDCLAQLLQPGDLRRALLQLQYLLLSGPPEVSVHSPNVRNTLWCDLRYNVYKPAIKMNKSRKGKKNTEEVITTNNTVNVLNVISEQLDSIALISTLVNIEDLMVNIRRVNLQPSLSLTEDYALYSSSHSVSSDIAEWIEGKTISNDLLSNQDGVQYRKNIALKKQLNTGVDTALSHVTSFVLDRQVISLDYVPCTRTICRAENSRSSTNGKRGHRFFHYLHGMKDSSTSLRPHILAAACKALQEKGGEDGS